MENMNFLIVDDSSTARMFIKRSISMLGIDNIKIDEAENGKEGLEKAKNNNYNLIISDLNMPIMDGENFLIRIKASPKTTSIPFLIITSISGSLDKNLLMKKGAFDVLNKPVSPITIQESLDDILKEV